MDSLYFLIPILAVGVILEIFWLFKKKHSFLADVLEHFFQKVILDTAREIMSDKEGRRFCGILLAIQFTVFGILAFFILHDSILHGEFNKIIIDSLTILIGLPVIMCPSYFLNHFFISYCKKNFKN